VSLELLDTTVWRSFVASRGLRAGTQAEQLLRIGLVDKVGEKEAELPTNLLIYLPPQGWIGTVEMALAGAPSMMRRLIAR
jgi:hypothetical protein